MHDEHVGRPAEIGDVGEIADRVEVRVLVHCRRQHVRRHAGDLQRLAVRRRSRDRLGADQAAAAGAVLDDRTADRTSAELLGQHPAQQVVGAAGGVGHDDAYRLGRPVRRRWCCRTSQALAAVAIEGGGAEECCSPDANQTLTLSAFMPSSLAIAASLSRNCLMPAANSAGPCPVTTWPVASSRFAIDGSAASTARTSSAMRSRVASGMPRGPKMPPGLSISSAGKPASRTVGTSGALGMRCLLVTARILILPACISGVTIASDDVNSWMRPSAMSVGPCMMSR